MGSPVAVLPEGAEQATRLSARLGRCAAGLKCLGALDAIGATTWTAEGRVEAARQKAGACGATADRAAPLRCMLLTSAETRDEASIITTSN